jgi:hypothetical protein
MLCVAVGFKQVFLTICQFAEMRDNANGKTHERARCVHVTWLWSVCDASTLQNETTQFGSRSVFIWAAVCVSDTDRLCGLCHSRSVSKLLNVAANCVFPCHTFYFADK